jgi:hypothetical protein
MVNLLGYCSVDFAHQSGLQSCICSVVLRTLQLVQLLTLLVNLICLMIMNAGVPSVIFLGQTSGVVQIVGPHLRPIRLGWPIIVVINLR